MTGIKIKTYRDVNTKNGDFVELEPHEMYERAAGGGVLYEGIYGPCKMYFDYDFTYDNEPDQLAAEVPTLKNIIKDITEFTGLEASRFAIFSASGPKATGFINSFHLIVNDGTVYPDGATIKNKIMDYGKLRTPPGYERIQESR